MRGIDMAEEEKVAESSGGDKKNKAILFVIVGIVVVLLLLIGIVVFLVLSTGGDSEEHAEKKEKAVVVEQPTQPSAQAAQIIVGNTITARNSNLRTPGPIIPIADAFTVNLMTQTGKRYLKTKMSLEIDKKETEPEITNKMDIIKDIIIEVLSSKSMEDISGSKGKGRVKDELVKRLNELITDGKINDIFFTEFVVN